MRSSIGDEFIISESKDNSMRLDAEKCFKSISTSLNFNHFMVFRYLFFRIIANII